MKRRALTLTVAGAMALAAAGVALAAALGDGESEKKCARFCLDVEETPDAPAGTYTLTGRGWLPDKRVEITHGTACHASGACDDRGVTTRLRSDPNGRFRLYFRVGDEPPPGLRPSSHGRGPLRVAQWRGRPYRSALVRRTAAVR